MKATRREIVKQLRSAGYTTAEIGEIFYKTKQWVSWILSDKPRSTKKKEIIIKKKSNK